MASTSSTFPRRPTAAPSLVDRKSTRLNSSHGYISYAVFCLKKKHRRNRRSPSRPDRRLLVLSRLLRFLRRPLPTTRQPTTLSRPPRPRSRRLLLPPPPHAPP